MGRRKTRFIIKLKNLLNFESTKFVENIMKENVILREKINLNLQNYFHQA